MAMAYMSDGSHIRLPIPYDEFVGRVAAGGEDWYEIPDAHGRGRDVVVRLDQITRVEREPDEIAR